MSDTVSSACNRIQRLAAAEADSYEWEIYGITVGRDDIGMECSRMGRP